mmetsp:Transcript_48589/g.150468  ORF Transcript_48589/g.150468 Transcript_48589/m.150468 type:complete len:287 (-) Transcript_48589:385-1245(-)
MAPRRRRPRCRARRLAGRGPRRGRLPACPDCPSPWWGSASDARRTRPPRRRSCSPAGTRSGAARPRWPRPGPRPRRQGRTPGRRGATRSPPWRRRPPCARTSRTSSSPGSGARRRRSGASPRRRPPGARPARRAPRRRSWPRRWSSFAASATPLSGPCVPRLARPPSCARRWRCSKGAVTNWRPAPLSWRLRAGAHRRNSCRRCSEWRPSARHAELRRCARNPAEPPWRRRREVPGSCELPPRGRCCGSRPGRPARESGHRKRPGRWHPCGTTLAAARPALPRPSG